MRIIATEQTHFQTADDWLRHYLAHGYPNPMTRDELMLADREGLLQDHPQWIPARENLKYLELPSHFGRRQRPLSDLFQERFLETLVTDPEFQAAVVNCLGATS